MLSFLIFEDYQRSIDNAGQTRDKLRLLDPCWFALRYRPNTLTQVYATLRSDIDPHDKIFILFLFFCGRFLTLWHLRSKQDKRLRFQVCCQGKAGWGHRIESIAWYAQTILYYTIFPNKKQSKRSLKKHTCAWLLFCVLSYAWLIYIYIYIL